MYQFILLHSCDYLKKNSVKINVATDEGNSRNEIGHCGHHIYISISIYLSICIYIYIYFKNNIFYFTKHVSKSTYFFVSCTVNIEEVL